MIMFNDNTMSTWMIVVFWELSEALTVETLLQLNSLGKWQKRLRYRFLQVPIKCNLELCTNQRLVGITPNRVVLLIIYGNLILA